MKQDRFLTAILVGIALLVAAALALFFARRSAEAYQPEDTPQGVVHNYLLALSRGEYERAYGYLAEGAGKPSYVDFRRQFADGRRLDNVGVTIGEVEIRAEAQAFVTLQLVYAASDPFSGMYEDAGLAVLERQQRQWKLLQMPYPFWGYEWFTPDAIPKP